MNKIILVFGTRPELIKIAPVVREFKLRGWRDRLFIVFTNQHPNIKNQDLEYFKIDIDYQFDLKRLNDNLTLLNGMLLVQFYELNSHLKNQNILPSALLAQGDTCSAFAASQYAFYEKIPLIHLEAGLRTGDFEEPFPEEYYRSTISSMATWHCAPSLQSKNQLIQEGYSSESIIFSGNTVIDNLRLILSDNMLCKKNNRNTVLITLHRRENMNRKISPFIERVVSYVKLHPEKNFVWIDNPGYKLTSSIPNHHENLIVLDPVAYEEMISWYSKSQLIITDSGGIQEEAAYLGIPTLVFRSKSERNEAIEQGFSKYWDEEDKDLDQVISALNIKEENIPNHIFGDGYAALRIVDEINKKGLIQ